MNLAYVSREYGPITGGGIGTYVANACRAMLACGHTVYLITDCVRPEHGALLPPELKVVPTLPMPPDRTGGCFSANHEYSHRIYRTLARLCEEQPVDVVEFAEYCGEGFVSIRAKRLLRAFAAQKLVVKCHTPLSLLEDINEERQFHASVVCDMEMEDYCVRHADQVSSPSQSLADYFRKRVGRNDVLICPYPLYLESGRPVRSIASRDLKVVRFFGSIQVRKGVDVFIEAAKRVLARDPSFRFELVGKERNAYFFNRSYTEVLKGMIPQSMSDRIVFTGEVSYDKVSSLLESSALVVLPSRWENWANACLESMAKGCVVLASSSGGMAEMVQDGVSGFLIDPHDPSALAEKMLTLAHQPSLLQRIADGAVERAAQLTEPGQTARRIESNYLKPLSVRRQGLHAMPLVSVVIPFFNQSTTIEETLASVKASRYPSIEVVVVNDGSTSPSAQRCFDQLKGVVKVSQANRGLSAARNAGIAASSGAYILPLDADDKLHPDYIRIAVDALERVPEVAYLTCYTRNFEAFDSPYYPLGFVPLLMPFMNTSGKCSNVYRRHVFEQTGGYDETLNSYEDWDFLLTLERFGMQGDVLPLELFFYRRNYASMVFSVANPIRANLIQYMMLKHRKLWESQSGMMAMILLRLWKDAEIREESLLHDEFHWYWGSGGGLSESRSRAVSYRAQGRLQLACTLPFDPDTDTLRLDFACRPMRILLHEVRVTDLLSGQDLLQASLEEGYDSIEVVGTACASQVRGRSLLIHSTGNDPQLLIRSERLKGAELRVSIDYEVIENASVAS
jgi:glycosyltransferase involved in cell wall biosynthesis